MKQKTKSILVLLVSFLTCNILLVSPAKSQKAEKETVITSNHAVTISKDVQSKTTPEEALKMLKAGNKRFVEDKQLKRNLKEEMKATAKGQYPIAVILSCVDSRTSSELIFDQGMGDVFNARIAGNFVNTDILGSMEFACIVAGSKLVLIVGHTKCGAVKGACDHVELGNLTHLIAEINPAVESTKNIPGERNSKNDAFVQAVAIQNVKMAMQEVREKSEILSSMEKEGQIIIAGAMYDIETGKVEFINE